MANIIEELSHLTSENLRDIARNVAAPMESRLAAVTNLRKRRSRYLQHPELLHLDRAEYLRDHPEYCPPVEPDPDSVIHPEEPVASDDEPPMLTSEEEDELREHLDNEDKKTAENLLEKIFGDDPEPDNGPFKASFTTANLMVPENVENGIPQVEKDYSSDPIVEMDLTEPKGTEAL